MKENNKIIAEFLDWTLCSYPTHMKSPFHGRNVWWSPGTTKSFCCIEGEEFFKNSWEWLMPVVEKIESLDFVFQIHHNVVNIFNGETKENGIYNETFQGKTKIKTVYNACIEFINFYNKQKEE